MRELAFTARELHEVVTDSWGLPAESVDIDALLGATEGGSSARPSSSTPWAVAGRASRGRTPSGVAFEYFAEITDRRLEADLLDFATASSLLKTADPEQLPASPGTPRRRPLRELLDHSLFIDSSAPGGALPLPPAVPRLPERPAGADEDPDGSPSCTSAARALPTAATRPGR